MHGFRYDKKDPYSTVSTKALRVCLRSRLPDLQSAIELKIETFFKEEMLQGETNDGIFRLILSLPIPNKLRMCRLENY